MSGDGTPPIKRSRGRPRKAPEERCEYGKPAPAKRIEGQEYRDRTGRLNPGAFSKGNTAGVGQPPRHVPKAVKALCRGYGPVAIETVIELMTDPDVAARDRINAAKLVLSYGEGLPRAEVAIEVETKIGWSDILADISKRKAEPPPPAALPDPDLLAKALAQVSTDAVMATVKPEGDHEDEDD